MTHTPAAHDAPPHDAQQERSASAESAAEHVPPPVAAAPAQPNGERRAVVRIGIALAALLFIGTSGLLYLRWATVREPMCFFIVEASTALRGAEVTVDGVKLLKPHAVTIGRGERFAIPFYLDYGTYAVRVTLNGQTVVDTEVTLDEKMPYQRLDLTQVRLPSSAAAPSAGPTGGSPTTSSSPPMFPSDTDSLPLTPPLPPSAPSDDGALR